MIDVLLIVVVVLFFGIALILFTKASNRRDRFYKDYVSKRAKDVKDIDNDKP